MKRTPSKGLCHLAPAFSLPLSALACGEGTEGIEPSPTHHTLAPPALSEGLQLVHLVTRYYDVREADWERTLCSRAS